MPHPRLQGDLSDLLLKYHHDGAPLAFRVIS